MSDDERIALEPMHRTTGVAADWPGEHEAARRMLAHALGGFRARLRPAGEGDFCLAFRQHARIVRVARHAEAAAALEREACVMSRIAAALPLPVPQPVFHRPAERCAFSVHARIPGAALTRRRWERLPPAVREEAARGLGRFLDALHALPVAEGTRCGVPTLDRAACATRLRRDAAVLASRLAPRVATRLDAALARWSAPAADDAEPAPVLLHRDVAPGHVLFDARSGALTGVIDFGDLAVGDPARDFIYVHEDFGPEILAGVLRGYGRESAATLLPRMHAWYLLETVEWAAACAGREDVVGMRQAVAEIATELELLGM